jgi:hypothetical protein
MGIEYGQFMWKDLFLIVNCADVLFLRKVFLV